MRILSFITLLLYCGLLFPTAAGYVNNKLVELQNNHKLFTFLIQVPTGHAGKCLSDQPDDDDTALFLAELPILPAANSALFQPVFVVRAIGPVLAFSARAPPSLLIVFG